jgi:hypothetical protein
LTQKINERQGKTGEMEKVGDEKAFRADGNINTSAFFCSYALF